MIYIAASVTMYQDPRYEQAIAWARERYGSALPSAVQWESTRHWLEGWPDLLPKLERIVVITDRQGLIGRGVYRELTEAMEYGTPIELLRFIDGEIVPVEDFELLIVDPDDWRRFARPTFLSED
jgi:hypothetical protein